MANGDLLTTRTSQAGAQRVLLDIYVMLDAQTGAGDGVWVDSIGAEAITLAVSGIGTGTLQVHGHHPTSPDTTPQNSNDHEQIGSDVTANLQYGITYQDVPHWFKVSKSVAGDSTPTTVIVHIKYRR